MHRRYPNLGGLALGLVLLAAPGGAAEYSGAALPEPASPDVRTAGGKFALAGGTLSSELASDKLYDIQYVAGTPYPREVLSAPAANGAGLPAGRTRHSSAEDGGRVRLAQSSDRPYTEQDAAEARKRLRQELDRMKEQPRRPRDAKPDAAKAEKKPKKPEAAAAEAPRAQPAKPQAPAIDPAIDRAVGKLLIMRFTGSQPSDPGPKTIRAFLHDGQIAGAMFGPENIQSRSQVKELIKSLWQGAPGSKPIFAISEMGGAGGGLPRVKEFEAWPSQQQVAAKGDPEYAYSTYRSLGSYLAGLGLTMNFGPRLGAPAPDEDASRSFGANPLQAGVFAKTFVLGHKDDNVLTVPIVDGSELAVRALKTLLVSYPATPIASTAKEGQPFAVYEGLVRGMRFCFAQLGTADPSEAAGRFGQGCDALVVDAGKDGAAAVRASIAQGVSDAIKNGALSLETLEASAQKLSSLRASSSAAYAAQTPQ